MSVVAVGMMVMAMAGAVEEIFCIKHYGELQALIRRSSFSRCII